MNRPIPKTIQIFLPQGDPRGIRVAEITTRTIQVVEVPRKLLKEYLTTVGPEQVALYFLVGADEDTSESDVYIGQTGDLKKRLKKHNSSLPSWERVIVAISRTNSMTQTHTLFLEWFCIDQVRKVGRFTDSNKNKGSRPHTPAPLEAECLELFETVSTLLATLGLPLFSTLPSTDRAANDDKLFTCTGSEAKGKGYYTGEGFVVLAGSRGRIESVPSMENSPHLKVRQEIIDAGILAEIDGMPEFTKDHLFNSPSKAAVVLMGRHANGWTEWKTADGKTLHDIYRGPNEEDDRED